MPPALVPADCECSYGTGANKVTFDAFMHTSVTMTPVEDPAKRTIIAWDHVLEVSAWVTHATATDAGMETIRDILTRPGDVLTFSKKGFGRLQVNDAANGNRDDVAGGPWPMHFSWRPAGNNLGAAINWKVRTTLPANVGYVYSMGILSFSYSVDYDIDDAGYTVMNIRGQITVPMTRKSVNDPAIPDDADRAYDKCVPLVALNFQRTNKHRSISEDKRTLTFSFTDRELVNVPPEDVSNWNIRHKIGSSLREGFETWRGSYSGTFTVQAGTPPGVAYQRFLVFVGNRLGLAKKNAIDLIKIDKKKGGTVLIDTIDVEEQLSNFSNQASFSINYRIVGCGIAKFLPVSGIYTDPDNDYTSWKESLAGSANHLRGHARIKRDAKDDRIIDLRIAGGQVPIIHTGSAKDPEEPAEEVEFDEKVIALGLKPENTWLHFENAISWIEDGRLAEHVPMAGNVTVKNGRGATNEEAIAKDKDKAGALIAAQRPNIIQQVGQPMRRLRMRGRAIRVGYPIEAPEIETVGGVEPRLLENAFVQTPVGKVGGVSVFGARWDKVYIVPSSPKGPLPQVADAERKLEGAG